MSFKALARQMTKLWYSGFLSLELKSTVLFLLMQHCIREDRAAMHMQVTPTQCPSSLLVGMSCLLPGDIDAQLNTANPT